MSDSPLNGIVFAARTRIRKLPPFDSGTRAENMNLLLAER
jgi:hypothetical protein